MPHSPDLFSEHDEPVDEYVCPCGGTFPIELGKHGCPACGGEFVAELRSVLDFIEELPW